MQIGIGYDKTKSAEAVEALFREFPTILKDDLNDGLDHAARSFMKRFQKEQLHGPFGSKVVARGGKGGMFRRFQRRPNLNDVSVTIRTRSAAVAGLEEGGTVSSSKGVPVPLYRNQFMFDTSGGRHRLKKQYRAMLYNDKLTKIKGRDGQEYLMDKKSGEALFVLKHSVRVPKRLGFETTFDKHKGRIFQILEGAVEKVLLNMDNPNYIPKSFKYSSAKFQTGPVAA